MQAEIPPTTPQEIAPETWLIPNRVAAGDGAYLPVNSMVIRGAEPVIVDTGAPIHRDLWKDKTFSLVEPSDVRWIFLSHDDGDHTGSLLDTLELCPNATLVANFFIVERLAFEYELPLQRMRWLSEGDSLDVGDRTLHLFKPPIFDGPTTRGIFDPSTATMWAVDSFAALVTEGVYDAHDVPADLYDESFAEFNSMISPWHQWLDPVAYGRHADSVEAMGLLTVASAHGPTLTGDFIHDAFDRVRGMAGQPILPGPGAEALDDMIADLLAGADDAPAPEHAGV